MRAKTIQMDLNAKFSQKRSGFAELFACTISGLSLTAHMIVDVSVCVCLILKWSKNFDVN